MARKDLLTRLADAGEDAIGRLGEAPGADRVLGAANSMRDRMDELQRRVRGLDRLEERVAELERRLEEVESRPRARTRAGGTRKSAAKSSAAKTAGSGTGKKATGTSKTTRTTPSGSKAEPSGPAT